MVFSVVLGATAAFVYSLWLPKPPPNIVLITIDTLRRDYLGSYGFADLQISPQIDALAARGTRFDQAVSVSGTTIPSHGSMLTGLYPRQHGARSNWFRLNPDVVTITQKLGYAGYETAAFVSFEAMMKLGGLERGFEYDNTPFDQSTGKVTQAGKITLQQSQQWLQGLQDDKPFYLWLHLFEPHGPYDMTGYARERIQGYQGILQNGADMKTLLKKNKQILDSEDNLRVLRQLYAGEVNLADRLVGQLISTLEEQGKLDNSVVIFTADHGQGLGENRQMGHGATLWESVIRVPLIVTDFRNPKTRVVKERVGTIDIAPTIADFAGLTEHFDLNGQSLRDTGNNVLDPKRVYFSSVELRTGKSADEAWYDPDTMAVYSGDFKLVSKRNQTRLFEIHPGKNRLTPIPRTQATALAEYMTGLSEDFLEMEGRVLASEVSESDQDQLQGLGYVQ